MRGAGKAGAAALASLLALSGHAGYEESREIMFKVRAPCKEALAQGGAKPWAHLHVFSSPAYREAERSIYFILNSSWATPAQREEALAEGLSVCLDEIERRDSHGRLLGTAFAQIAK